MLSIAYISIMSHVTYKILDLLKMVVICSCFNILYALQSLNSDIVTSRVESALICKYHSSLHLYSQITFTFTLRFIPPVSSKCNQESKIHVSLIFFRELSIFVKSIDQATSSKVVVLMWIFRTLHQDFNWYIFKCKE